MKRTLLEKSTVVVLFILVLVVFSFAERDTQKMVKFYKANMAEINNSKPEKSASVAPLKKGMQSIP